MWMSGAVGSRPSFTRSGVPVASERSNFFSHSACGSNSSQPRSETAMASRTRSLTTAGTSAVFKASDIGSFLGTFPGIGPRAGCYTRASQGPPPVYGGCRSDSNSSSRVRRRSATAMSGGPGRSSQPGCPRGFGPPTDKFVDVIGSFSPSSAAHQSLAFAQFARLECRVRAGPGRLCCGSLRRGPSAARSGRPAAAVWSSTPSPRRASAISWRLWPSMIWTFGATT